MREPIRAREPDFGDRLKYAAMIAGTILPIMIALAVARDNVVYALPVVMVLIIALIFWHARNTAYRCRHCGHEFAVPVWRDAFSPHMIESKYLKCPECGKRSWAKALVLDR